MNSVDTYKINPNVSVDNVILGFDQNDLKVLLIERRKGTSVDVDFLALPGDLIYEHEDLDEAANRILLELTGLKEIYLQQFHTFGSPNRISKKEDLEWIKQVRAHPEARVITIAYYTLVNIEHYDPKPSGFADSAIWVSTSNLPNLAFDHNQIFEKALDSLRWQLYRQPIGFELLPEKFTMAQLQRLYEIILQTELDKRNFRRKILKTDLIIPLDEKQLGVAHKPAQLYSFDKEKFNSKKFEFPVF